ncbi:hypothetical protein [Mesorhizobium sp. B1-1-8]|uniref:hypothetical protein n=1 Tax=Mesorhizobium sp. B1-1-8 TaxID=2589976 RepID=UPI00112D4322|nr:hypothetical protein [Mesorhizobium sp. B1-1-8]UCI08697.1 hypothetical protein FJ974_06400 [Mesorhizobium sp. B1-1-8]
MSLLTLQLFSILLTAYAFVIPIPPHLALLFALSVSFVMSFCGHLETAMELNRKRALESIWLNELTMRFGTETLAAAGGRPLQIDWQEMTTRAAADIRLHDQDMKIQDQLSYGGPIDFVVSALSAVVPVAVRLALGWGLAVLAIRFFPGSVAAL